MCQKNRQNTKFQKNDEFQIFRDQIQCFFCKTAFFVTIAISLLPQNPDLGPLCTVRKIPFCAKLGKNPKLTFPYLILHKMNFFGYEKILWSNLNQFFTLRPLCAISKKSFLSYAKNATLIIALICFLGCENVVKNVK